MLAVVCVLQCLRLNSFSLKLCSISTVLHNIIDYDLNLTR